MNIDESSMNNSDTGTENWTPSSWRERTALQQPSYPDLAALEGVQNELACLPPLVTSWEILALKKQLAEAKPSFLIVRKSAFALGRYSTPDAP